MALLINNDVTARALAMMDAVDAMEAVLKQHARVGATFRPRADLWAPTAIGRVVYDKAKETKLGMPIPMEWFQQDIRN